MGKKPLNENQVKSLRKLVSGKPLHELLLNLSVDLMLRGSDLMNLKVSDVISENGKVKTEVMVRQKKTKKSTLRIPLSDHSIKTIQKHLMDRSRDDYIFKGQKSYTGKPISVIQYTRIVKQWMEMLGVDPIDYSSHSIFMRLLTQECTKNSHLIRSIAIHQLPNLTGYTTDRNRRVKATLLVHWPD